MKLSTQDTDLFFELMWSLQFYVARQLDLMPGITTQDEYRAVDGNQRIAVRQALWDNLNLIDAYVQTNPDGFDPERLAIIAGWKQCVRGTFILERLLKDHAIFIGNDETVYGVKALYAAFDEIIPRTLLPTYIHAVLLPYKGQIIYDGLLSRPTRTILFGGGLRRSFKEIYMVAKREGRIILSLDPAVQARVSAETSLKLKDWSPQLAGLAKEAGSWRAQSGSPSTWGAAFSLVKASLALAQAVVQPRPEVDDLWRRLDRAQQALERLGDAIRRLE